MKLFVTPSTSLHIAVENSNRHVEGVDLYLISRYVFSVES